jgi:hypothetical protein
VESRFARFLAMGIDTVREFLVSSKISKNPILALDGRIRNIYEFFSELLGLGTHHPCSRRDMAALDQRHKSTGFVIYRRQEPKGSRKRAVNGQRRC